MTQPTKKKTRPKGPLNGEWKACAWAFYVFCGHLLLSACGSRRTVEQAEPTPPTSRGIISSQKTSWQGTPTLGTVKTTTKPGAQPATTPGISIFFLRESLTTSDGDDFQAETEIKSWFGPEPIDR